MNAQDRTEYPEIFGEEDATIRLYSPPPEEPEDSEWDDDFEHAGGEVITVGDLRKFLDGKPDNTPVFISCPSENEDYAVIRIRTRTITLMGYESTLPTSRLPTSRPVNEEEFWIVDGVVLDFA